jgi:inner membrane protein
MPSLFTHAFVGAAISTLAPAGYRGLGLAAGLGALAALPDLDVVAFRFGVGYAHPLGHRGLSHSLPFAALISVPLWWWLVRRSGRSPRLPEFGLLAVIFLACASHGFLDAFTDAGLGVGFFVPFNDARYFFPWRPILTSPLEVGEFFAGRGMTILRNEIGWVWLPTALLVGVLLAARRHYGESRA